VLTGDKVETAINIAFSCKLITKELKQHLIKIQKDDTKKFEDMENEVSKQLLHVKNEIYS